jgi:hypothetical protein
VSGDIAINEIDLAVAVLAIQEENRRYVEERREARTLAEEGGSEASNPILVKHHRPYAPVVDRVDEDEARVEWYFTSVTVYTDGTRDDNVGSYAHRFSRIDGDWLI